MNEVPFRLLREALQARGPTGPTPECLDAETVAAWADDTLGRGDRRAAEAHAADCGRCQALVAAMAHTAPPAAARSWWRAPAMGWLVPLTAAAAAVLVWMSVPGTPRQPASTSIARAIDQEPVRPSEDGAMRRETEIPPPSAAAQSAAKVNGQAEKRVARGRAQTSAAGEIGAQPPAATAEARPETARGPGPPSPSIAPAPTNAPSQPQPAAGGVAAGPPVSVQRTAAQAGSAGARNLLLDAQRFPTVIVSPNRTSQWRILSSNAVQHSTDGGATWEVQPTGADVMLTAGASPAPSICWLVGPRGIVLLSTDGRSWRRIAFPEAVDLGSVRATDENSATVNTADGRAFSTTDGGQTWTR